MGLLSMGPKFFGVRYIIELVKRESGALAGKLIEIGGKISVPEVRVDWRELAENLLLVLLSVILYTSVIFTPFSFVPFIIISVKRGWKIGAISLASSSAILLFMMVKDLDLFPFDISFLLLSPLHYAFEFIGSGLGIENAHFMDFIFLFGIPGIVAGHLIGRNYKLKYVMLCSILVYTGIVFTVLLASSFIGGFKNYIEDYRNYVDNRTSITLNENIDRLERYKNFLESKGISPQVIEKKLKLFTDLYKNGVIFGIGPRGGYLLLQILLLFTSVLIVKIYFKKKITKAALSFDVKNYQISDDWVWGLIFSWGLVYVNLHLKNVFLGMISWNAATIFSFMYFLKGLSIIKLIADRLKIPQILQYLGLLFLLFSSFIVFSVVVTGIGVADIWLRIQDKIDGKSNVNLQKLK